MTFAEFFEIATGAQPYHYQRRLAEADDLPELIRVPTGAGKTAAVVLAWLWRRRCANAEVRNATSRRLVYTLPMRTLVEQTCSEARRWLGNLRAAPHSNEQELVSDLEVYTLMGGEPIESWDLDPERDAILIGTQDMVLSRALNRGYAASRFRWPIEFGLLNNDCLWVYDEPQLMGNALATSAQLAGLRTKLKTFGPCRSVWMSATLEQKWLETVDLSADNLSGVFELQGDDHAEGRPLHKRMTAAKILVRSVASTAKDGKDLARRVVEEYHRAGTQTLVVLNTVNRAKAVYEAVKQLKTAPKDVRLIHSRFRPAEREQLNKVLREPRQNRIIIATQVVEAGVDLSARTLVTELCPWSSLVQRIGRCNRTGDDGPGQVFWVDLADKESAPYEPDELRFARDQVAKLEGRNVSPRSLDLFTQDEAIQLPFKHNHVLRRRDLLDLFDTTPDLSGNDIDVSRFIRGDTDSDVQVFWRSLALEKPNAEEPNPSRRELCRVPVRHFRSFLEKERSGKRPDGYVWNHLDQIWTRVNLSRLDQEIYPGRIVLLPTTAGGYSAELGWDDGSTALVDPVTQAPTESEKPEGARDDPGASGPALSIATHTENVCQELERILTEVAPILESWSATLRVAARWHDAGKGHQTYQEAIRRANPELHPPEVHWAKSGRYGRILYHPPHFRHELVSALATLEHDEGFAVAYLTASHHGRVRLSIRALPDEVGPEDSATLFALGVRDQDLLEEVDLGGGVICPKTRVNLAPMRLGGEQSWTAQALALRDRLGPFRLAYLEASLRAADRRASRDERTAAEDRP